MERIKIENPEMLFFTSDQHFGHKSIIHLANRPFASLDEMGNVLIVNWKRKVSFASNAKVFTLGDFCMKGGIKAIRDKEMGLSGDITFIRGNHDGSDFVKAIGADRIHDMLLLDVADPDAHNGRQEIVLCHYPLREWLGYWRGAWHLHGHTHGELPDDRNAYSMDVGVDTPYANYAPISYYEVKAFMEAKKENVLQAISKRDGMGER